MMQTRQRAAWQTVGRGAVAESTRVIADGGASVIAPRDTMLAFRLAVELGADGIATEVRCTADGAFVLLRNGDVSRTTDGVGAVEQLRWEQLATCDAGYWFSQGDSARYPYRGLKVGVPRLEDLRDLVTFHPDLEVHIGVDALLAASELPAQGLKALGKRLTGLGLAATTTLWTRRLDLLDSIRRAVPDSRLACALDWSSELDTALALGSRWDDLVLHVDGAVMEAWGPSVVERAHDAGCAIFFWAAAEWADFAEVHTLGFDGVVTDNPERSLQIR